MKVEIIKPSVGVIAARIVEHLERAGSPAERREIAMTWSGYVGSLLEWGAIEPGEHDDLRAHLNADLPEDAPIQRVFLGFEEDERDAPAQVAVRVGE